MNDNQKLLTELAEIRSNLILAKAQLKDCKKYLEQTQPSDTERLFILKTTKNVVSYLY